jgi:hypothetical protein
MELSEITKKYWSEKDWEDLEKAEKVSDLFVIAERILDKIEKPFGQVCGPIGNGGLGSVEANLNAFNETIKKLQKEGHNIFDQMPFEAPMQRFKKMAVDQQKIYDSIMNDFYGPIFHSGKISRFYFMPNWKTSKGAEWEHEKAKELGIEIIYLD